jgi:mercuric ion transport protein
VGAVVLVVSCCIALPALLAGGALGVIGGLLGNPVVIVTGLVGAAGGVVALLARAARRGRPDVAGTTPTDVPSHNDGRPQG